MKVTVKIVQEINKLYDSGQTLRQLGTLFGLDKHTISNYVWHPRPRGGRYNKTGWYLDNKIAKV